LSYTPAYRAAFHHFHCWLEGGPPPPPQARIEFESADPPTSRRDQYGNALGGINCMSCTPTRRRISTSGRLRSTAASQTSSSCPKTPQR
jgi:hypothetical protein